MLWKIKKKVGRKFKKIYLKILSWANCFIANNNIRSVILEIKNGRCKIVKILIFRSLSSFSGKKTKY